MAKNTAEEGDIMVWYIPQVPMKAYEIRVPSRDLAEAQRIQEAVIGLSYFEYLNNVKPDYSDASGISRYESDGEDGFGWFDVDDDELARHV